jgi:hypothetical protein
MKFQYNIFVSAHQFIKYPYVKMFHFNELPINKNSVGQN